ncbi:MAG: hypothetical protein QE263_08450 [Vampirovibrionales bacterium]|nr:hypothetical protein [Vampirovibrionales bacterium]
MSGNMPNNYFPYDRRFSNNQDFQNRRFPDGQPNTYNRNQFRPFGRPQDCFQPSFNPGWGGNNNCNPCEKLALANDAERTKLEFDAQNKERKASTVKAAITAGAAVFGLAILLPFMRKIIGTPAVKDNNTGSGTPSASLSATGGGATLKTKEQLDQEAEQAVKGWTAKADQHGAVVKTETDQEKKAREEAAKIKPSK